MPSAISRERTTLDQSRTASVVLRQVAPGRYEATVLADAVRPVTVSTTDATGAAISRVVVADPAAEYRFRATDEALLRSIASATGGTWKPEPSELSSAPTDKHSERRPLWPALTVAALCLWFIDLLLRRIRVFEPQVAGAPVVVGSSQAIGSST